MWEQRSAIDRGKHCAAEITSSKKIDEIIVEHALGVARLAAHYL